MIKKICLFVIAIFLFACSKNNSSSNNNPPDPTPKPLPTITSFSPVTGAVDTLVTITGTHFNPDISKDIVKFNGTTAQIKSGTETQLIVTVPSGASTGKITVTVDTATAVTTQDFTVQSGSQWTLISSFPGTFMQKMTSFIVGNKLYIGIGQSNFGNLTEFWQYDILSGVWKQKSSFPAMPLPGLGLGFSAGNKGYVIMPDSSAHFAVWEYDTASDIWTAKGFFPGYLQQGMIAFSIDNYAYVGPGGNGASGSPQVWQYNPSANTWTRKADYPGAGTTYPASFTIGHYAYVGTGMTGFNTPTGSKDFYRYDPSSDTWIRKADFPGLGRNSAAGFAIGNYGYLGTGYNTTGTYTQDFWQYNPAADSWIQIKDFGGSYRGSAGAFSGSRQGYVGFGMGLLHQAGPGGAYNNTYIDLWQYQP